MDHLTTRSPLNRFRSCELPSMNSICSVESSALRGSFPPSEHRRCARSDKDFNILYSCSKKRKLVRENEEAAEYIWE
ncbi:ABC transporter G family member [Trichinella spiralis]|uniref:ABC transporter G family member n=1 Tax=Trichinella spiralis TaxID=6334 RepID=A0ABR3KZG0_TRISP